MKKTIKPELKNIKTIGVIGAGQMGRGIAQVAAQTGYETIVVEPYDAMLKKSQDDIARNLSRLVELGKIKNKEKDAIIGRIRFEKEFSTLADSDFVIEAAVENSAVKTDIFSSLDKICAPHVILTTNTSSVRLGKLATATNRPDKVFGNAFHVSGPECGCWKSSRLRQPLRQATRWSRSLRCKWARLRLRFRTRPALRPAV